MKKMVIAFALLMVVSNVFAQTFEMGTPERKAVMDALRVPVQKDLDVPVQFVVQTLNVVGSYAFMMGVPQQKNGKPINYLKTSHKEHYESEAFDDHITALLKLNGKKWKVLTYNIGGTDVFFGCWWKEYNAPKSLFDGSALPDCDYQ
ncbi:MAG: hypothetical protein WCL34_07490 [Methylococcaceae bacterium]